MEYFYFKNLVSIKQYEIYKLRNGNSNALIFQWFLYEPI